MKKVYVAIITLILIFFSIQAFSSQEIDIDTPYMEYSLDTQKIITDRKITISYLDYTLSGKDLVLDLKNQKGKISSARCEYKDWTYFGDIYFTKDYLKITDGKVYKNNSIIFGAKKIVFYPDMFLQASNLTLYTENGRPIFGIPYYSKLLFFPEHHIFPYITISKTNITISSYIDYYSSPSSFGFFYLKWDNKLGPEVYWAHYLTQGFGIFLDTKTSSYGLLFRNLVSLSLSNDFVLKVSYKPEDSFIDDIYLDYTYKDEKTDGGVKFHIDLGKMEVYSQLEYNLTGDTWNSLKIGLSPHISPFRFNMDYDFIKEEIGIGLYLNIK